MISDKLAVDALDKIKTIFFKDWQRIPEHSEHNSEIALRGDIRIPNSRMPPLLTANREILRKYWLSMWS
jgi:hypothetical protein